MCAKGTWELSQSVSPPYYCCKCLTLKPSLNSALVAFSLTLFLSIILRLTPMWTMLSLLVLREAGSLNVVLQSNSGTHVTSSSTQLINTSSRSDITRYFDNILDSWFHSLCHWSISSTALNYLSLSHTGIFQGRNRTAENYLNPQKIFCHLQTHHANVSLSWTFRQLKWILRCCGEY